MDLTTNYLGLELKHPFITGASPLADTVDSAKRVEDAGAAAIVMRSLFEEQINREALATHASTESHAETSGEALSYFPQPEEFVMGPDEYLEKVRRVKEAVGVPVIASLNGDTIGGWLDHARLIEEAGADALELNVYHLATDPEESGESIARTGVEMVESIKRTVSIPVAIKLGPFYASLVNFASRLVRAGADGLVLFNRFHEPDIDIEELEVESRLSLSDSRELPLRLRWLAILSGRIGCDLAVTGGVHTTADAVKAIMCGADAVQLVSALYAKGLGHLRSLHRELLGWLEEKEYDSLSQMRGSMDLMHCPNPRAFERGNYMHILQTWE